MYKKDNQNLCTYILLQVERNLTRILLTVLSQFLSCSVLGNMLKEKLVLTAFISVKRLVVVWLSEYG